MRVLNEIENAGALIEVFGHWPTCHDAEVSALRFVVSEGGGASLEAELDIAEPSPEVDDRGYYRVRASCRATLRFERLVDVLMADFDYQNVLWELVITTATQPARPEGRHYPIAVEFQGNVGCTLTFRCEKVAVKRVDNIEQRS